MGKPWGIVREDASGVTLSREYLSWLASLMNDTCNCGPHLDHLDCLIEEEGFIKYFSKEEEEIA